MKITVRFLKYSFPTTIEIVETFLGKWLLWDVRTRRGPLCPATPVTSVCGYSHAHTHPCACMRAHKQDRRLLCESRRLLQKREIFSHHDKNLSSHSFKLLLERKVCSLFFQNSWVLLEESFCSGNIFVLSISLSGAFGNMRLDVILWYSWPWPAQARTSWGRWFPGQSSVNTAQCCECIFSLQFPSLHFLCSSLLYCQSRVYNNITCKMCVTRLCMWSLRLPSNRRLSVVPFQGSQS